MGFSIIKDDATCLAQREPSSEPSATTVNLASGTSGTTGGMLSSQVKLKPYKNQ